MMPLWLSNLLSFARRTPPPAALPPQPAAPPEQWDKWPDVEAEKQRATITLYRMASPDGVTFGRIETREREQLCFTLEEPWRDLNHDGVGDRNICCSPAGRYRMFLRKSHLHGGTGKRKYDVPQLVGVPGRDALQIHIGNTLEDTLGCILVGTRIGKLEGDPAVLGSEDAHKKVMRYLLGVDDDEWTIDIVDA